MAKRTPTASGTPLPPGPRPDIGPTALSALTVLGVSNALWALFQWGQLMVMRSGGATFCAAGETVNCDAVWNAGFASWIHATTGVPVAGWGLVWGLLATALPLWALARQAAGRPLEDLVSAIRLTAGVGVLATLVLAVVAFNAGAVCLGCLGTYVLVGAYAVLSFVGFRRAAFPRPARAALRTAALLVVFYLLLLVPGLRTPRSLAEAALADLPAAGRVTAPAATPAPAADAQTGPSALAQGRPTGDAERDSVIAQYVRSLRPELKQALADSLSEFDEARAGDLRPARSLIGPADAPVRITEWTDVLCPHCERLHAVLGQLMAQLPRGSMAVEARHFPLDATCNPAVQRQGTGVSCAAAKAQICMEGSEHAPEFASRLFQEGRRLTPDGVYELARPWRDPAEVRACAQSPETAAKLKDDIDWALAHDIRGTPFVLVNGRPASAFGPFLYTVVLNEGRPRHPAFAELPAPQPHDHPH